MEPEFIFAPTYAVFCEDGNNMHQYTGSYIDLKPNHLFPLGLSFIILIYDYITIVLLYMPAMKELDYSYRCK